MHSPGHLDRRWVTADYNLAKLAHEETSTVLNCFSPPCVQLYLHHRHPSLRCSRNSKHMFEERRNMRGGGDQNSLEFIYKILCIYSYLFKFQSPSKISPFDAIHILICFLHCSKQFLNASILMPFSASVIFVSPPPHWQNVSFWGIFSSRKTKTNYSGWDQVNREGRATGSCHFWWEKNRLSN